MPSKPVKGGILKMTMESYHIFVRVTRLGFHPLCWCITDCIQLGLQQQPGTETTCQTTFTPSSSIQVMYIDLQNTIIIYQNSDIHLFDINYNYIIPLHKKIICISQETPTKTRYIVASTEATLRYIEIFNYLTLKFSYHYIFRQ